MKYRCTTIPLFQLISGPAGFLYSLCDTCKTVDCENPIEKKKVSVVGVKKQVKIYMRGNSANFVVECQGYIR